VSLSAEVRWWERAYLLLCAATFFFVASGIANARPRARHTTAAMCLGIVGLGLPSSIISPFGLYFLVVAIYLWLPSTAAEFRRAGSQARTARDSAG